MERSLQLTAILLLLYILLKRAVHFAASNLRVATRRPENSTCEWDFIRACELRLAGYSQVTRGGVNHPLITLFARSLHHAKLGVARILRPKIVTSFDVLVPSDWINSFSGRRSNREACSHEPTALGDC